MTKAQRKVAIVCLTNAIEDCRVKADDPNEPRWEWIEEAKALRAAINVTRTDRKIVDHMLALQNELDAERDRRHAATQRADRERARRLAEAPRASDEGEAMVLRSVRVAIGLPPTFTGEAGDEPVLDAVRRLVDDANRCDVCAKEGVTIAICGQCSVADHAKKASGR